MIQPIWLLWFALGCCVGSFLNVCIWRLPRDQSIIRPRSHCPHCTHPIAWHDNVPIVSYLILGARCRQCRGAIHWRYPLIEALSGLAAVVVLQRFGVGPVGLVYLCFVWALIAVTVIDLEHQIIPDEISVGGLLLALVLSPLIPQLHGAEQALVALRRAVLGAAVGAGSLYATGLLGSLIFRKEAMGGGDVKLLGMAGAVLGWKLVLLTFFLAPLLAVLPGLAVLALKRSHVIPYGPFLSLALILSLFAGDRIMQASGMEESIRYLWLSHG